MIYCQVKIEGIYHVFTGSTGTFDELICHFPRLPRCLRGEEGIRAKLLSSDGGILISAFFQDCSQAVSSRKGYDQIPTTLGHFSLLFQ